MENLKGRKYVCNLSHKNSLGYRYGDAKKQCQERKGFIPEYIELKSTKAFYRYLYICYEFQEDYDRTHMEKDVMVRYRHPEWFGDDDLCDYDDLNVSEQ